MRPTLREYEAMLRLDFMTFVHRSFCELNPQTPFLWSPHMAVTAARLEDCWRGRITRLIVNQPPRSLKSHIVSVAFPAWLLGHDPSKQIICVSYGQDLADKLARDCRSLMSSPFYQRLFPETRLSSEKQSVNEFITTKNGFRLSTSMTGVLTGRGADLIILDDPLKPDDALSETRRNAANDGFDGTLLSRLNSKEKGTIILVMQRLHQNDLVGHVCEQGHWDTLSFPAVAEADEFYEYDNVFGKNAFSRKAGEALQPERESLSTLKTIRITMGEYHFASQYQQNPMPLGGMIVKSDWIKHYDPENLPSRFSFKIQSWDTANKSGQLNDFSVCTTWGVFDRHYYLLDVFRKRVNFPDLKRAVKEQARKHEVSIILIEDKASGTQLIQDLKSEGMFGIRPYDPRPGSDKTLRLYAQTAEFENGRVLLPRSALWLDEYTRELTSFPGCKFDDQVDSTTQALDHLKSTSNLDVWERL